MKACSSSSSISFNVKEGSVILGIKFSFFTNSCNYKKKNVNKRLIKEMLIKGRNNVRENKILIYTLYGLPHVDFLSTGCIIFPISKFFSFDSFIFFFLSKTQLVA